MASNKHAVRSFFVTPAAPSPHETAHVTLPPFPPLIVSSRYSGRPDVILTYEIRCIYAIYACVNTRCVAVSCLLCDTAHRHTNCRRLEFDENTDAACAYARPERATHSIDARHTSSLVFDAA